jgi:hypothetical protein
VKWLADWCLVRGVNLLIAHAFYYSIAGPRKDERPPQLGPHSAWWDRFKPFAEHCTRLCWLNAQSQHVCEIAILAESDHCPWPAAKACFEHQRDFNYLDVGHVGREAQIDEQGVQIGPMRYPVLIVDGFHELKDEVKEQLGPMLRRGHVIHYQPEFELPGAAVARDAGELVARLDGLIAPDIVLGAPAPALRVRHLVHGKAHHLYLLFNETKQPIGTRMTVSARGKAEWINTSSGETSPISGNEIAVELGPYQMSLLHVAGEGD